MSLQTGRVQFSFIHRHDRFFRFDNETLKFIYLTENQYQLETGSEYELFIEVNNLSSKGLRVGYEFQLTPEFSFTPLLSVLQPEELLEGVLVGNATTVTASDYDFHFESDLSYDKDPLYDRQNHQLSGNGVSLDICATYQVLATLGIAAEMRDIYSRFKINIAPYTTAAANSSIKTYDENGYVIYDPVVTGYEGFRDIEFEFEPRTKLSLIYSLNQDVDLIAIYSDLPGVDFIQLDMAMTTDNSQSIIRGHWIPELHAAGLSYRSKYWQLGFIADSFSYSRMKTLGINIGLNLIF
jgi:hypothetical protein